MADSAGRKQVNMLVRNKMAVCSGGHDKFFGSSALVPCGVMTVIGVSTLPNKEVDAYGAKTLGEDVVEE